MTLLSAISRAVGPSIVLFVAVIAFGCAQDDGEQGIERSAPADFLTHGPRVTGVVGHEATIWARARRPGNYRVVVTSADGRERIAIKERRASPDIDLCLSWRIADGIRSNVRYVARIVEVGPDDSADPWRVDDAASKVEFTGAPSIDRPGIVSVAVGSCADDVLFPMTPVWDAIRRTRPDAMLLIGDTPYIDSTDPEVQFRRYREFFAHGGLPQLMREVPTYGLWDDHDYGADNADGRLDGKENSSIAFLSYHPFCRAGVIAPGAIYYAMRIGAVEFFMLDARWFAKRQSSPFDESLPTLLGREQWDWLKEGLAASTAPFKAIVSGTVFSDVEWSGKTDHWGAYPHERRGLFDFISQKKIGGVVLISGDLHRSRITKFPPEATGVGYTIYEIVASPLAQGLEYPDVVKAPNIVVDCPGQSMWAEITADTTVSPARLRLRILSPDAGERARFDLSLRDLLP